MKTTFSLFALFYSIMSFGDVFEVYFDIDNEGKSYEILDLNASVKAKKIIRDNAYLSFSLIKNKNPKRAVKKGIAAKHNKVIAALVLVIEYIKDIMATPKPAPPINPDTPTLK